MMMDKIEVKRLNNYREYVNQMYEAVNRVDKIYERWAKMKGIGYYDMLLFYALIENNGEKMAQSSSVMN